MKKRILLVDDHPLLRQGISRLVDQQEDLVTCGEAEDRASAMMAIARTNPDLAVVDLSLKEDRGLELIRDCRVQYPELLLLVLSMHDERFYAERSLRAGARGYIMKREASEKVLEAIRRVLAGEVFVSSAIAGSILCKVAGAGAPVVQTPWDRLSDRELDVFLLLGKGCGSHQIARRLSISIKTVETHRANIKIKIGVSTSEELLQQAIGCALHLGEL